MYLIIFFSPFKYTAIMGFTDFIVSNYVQVISLINWSLCIKKKNMIKKQFWSKCDTGFYPNKGKGGYTVWFSKNETKIQIQNNCKIFQKKKW